MAENPYLTTCRAMELSKQMMDGEKWNTFVLQLSFIGWYLLCRDVYKRQGKHRTPDVMFCRM